MDGRSALWLFEQGVEALVCWLLASDSEHCIRIDFSWVAVKGRQPLELSHYKQHVLCSKLQDTGMFCNVNHT